MNNTSSNPMDLRRVILSAVVLSALGAMFYNLLPMFWGVTQDYREFDNRSIGILSSLFFAGFTLTTITAFFWIRRANWRVVTLVTLCLGSMALLLAGYSESYMLLMICLFVAGGAFGAIYGIGTTALGDTSNPARWYGLKISAEAMLGMILLFVLPGTLISSHGFMGMMAGMVLTVLLLAPTLIWLPATGNTPRKNGGMRVLAHPQLKLSIWIGLFAVAAFIFSATMIWEFVERLAGTRGLDAEQAGKILSLALLFAILGSMTAAALGDRFGFGRPFVVATTIFLLALVLLANTASLATYTIGACLLMFSIGLGMSYVITIVAGLDMDGRHVVLTVPAIGIGVMMAPVIGGLVTTSQDYSALFMFAGITAALSLLAGLLALHKGLAIVERSSPR